MQTCAHLGMHIKRLTGEQLRLTTRPTLQYTRISSKSLRKLVIILAPQCLDSSRQALLHAHAYLVPLKSTVAFELLVHLSPSKPVPLDSFSLSPSLSFSSHSFSL